jgi:multisubunit Na+/H+ antiporter MnhG subunit
MKYKIPSSVFRFFNNSYTNNKITKNKYVLYIVAILSLIQLIYFLSRGSLGTIFLFIVLAIAMFQVSRNMTVVLAVPLILVNVFLTTRVIKEGLENATKTKDSDSDKDTDKEKNKDSDKSSDKKKDKEKEKTPEPFEVGAKQRPGATGGPRIDYGSTMENAYDRLNSILGTDGMKGLTQDTQKLVEQQKQLSEAMSSMAPLMENAKQMMDTLHSTGLGNILGGNSAPSPDKK